jgi:hypothetical protein
VLTQTRSTYTDRSSAEALAFSQQRISRYLLMYGSLGASFLLFRTVVSLALGGADHLVTEIFTLRDYSTHALAVALCYAGWLALRKGERARAYIEAVELASLGGAMIAYEVMGYFMSPVFGSNTVFLALTMGLFARSIYVPSTARRSLLLAVAAAIPHLVIHYFSSFKLPSEVIAAQMEAMEVKTAGALRMLQLGFMSLWWTATITTTAAASFVIYGLRREVRQIKRLGQYQLEEKIGEGGMGIVYRASHGMLQRPTAVKLLPEGKVGEASLARFEREVRLTARLSHPNTVTIFDYGHTPEGVFYYAMELLRGATLSRLVDKTGPMPAARVVHVLVQAAGALGEAHGVGLIHRDIKPANIMLCEQGGIPDAVKVLDFGLVKEVADAGAGGATQIDVIKGTPQYMAPESLTNPAGVDGRADLYALGAVGFFLLTGKEVFEGKTIVEICGHHLHTPPRLPSALVDGVPADLERVILKCLEKSPDDRPADAHELEALLEACACSGTWRTPDARAWWAEHPSLK